MIVELTHSDALRTTAGDLYKAARAGKGVRANIRCMPRRRPFLTALAEQVGILPSYVDQFGRTHRTADRVRVALLEAMGIEARSEAAARAELARAREQQAAQLIAPVRVAERSAARRLPLSIVDAAPRRWAVEISL